MLRIDNLHGWYGESHVLHGMRLSVRRGEVVTLLGRNGAGKTSTLRAIMGIMDKRSGSVGFQEQETVALPSEKIARLGIAYCPEERGIFSSLNVLENLMLPPRIAEGGLSLQEILTLFPNLSERSHAAGNRLSGGEQQMLAIARILRTGAPLLLLDEPTEGLAPVIIQQIAKAIQTLKRRGFTILLVEQNARFAAQVADRHYIVENGMIADQFSAGEFEKQTEKINGYLGV